MHPECNTKKPAHLGPRYAEQFEDVSVVAAYSARPPYPLAFFDFLQGLHAPDGPRRILELGCGTGDVTLGLLSHADEIHAVEPSSQMLLAALERAMADDPRIKWINAAAEEAPFAGPYSLAVAAESLHWMEWSVALPKVARALAPDAHLVIADRGWNGASPWDCELAQLISKYSTNQDYRPYDLAEELKTRGLFTEVGRRSTVPIIFSQSIDDHIKATHSRNGFSRQRMDGQAAGEFDQQFRNLLEHDCPGGIVSRSMVVNMIWGKPTAA